MAGGSRTSSHACSAPVFDTSNEKGISNFCRSCRVQFVKLNERCAVSVVSSTAGLKYPTTGWAKLSVLANSSRHRTSRPYRFSLRQNEAWLTADGTHTHTRSPRQQRASEPQHTPSRLFLRTVLRP